MSGQTKMWSAVESLTQPLVGLAISWGVALLIFPLYGVELSLFRTLEINLWFFAASFVRQYLIRRLFNKGVCGYG